MIYDLTHADLDKIPQSAIIRPEILAIPFRQSGRWHYGSEKMKPHFLQEEEWGFSLSGKMQQNSGERGLFSGLVFWGSEFLPRDLILSPDSIRKWASDQKLIWDVEAQLMASERMGELEKHFSSEDKLFLLIHLYKDDFGNLSYMEYPFLPVKSVIRRAREVEIVYWRIMPCAWDAEGKAKEYGEVQFGFWYPGINADEFCSISDAKLIVKKFHELYQRLSDNYAPKVLDKGTLEIEVNGKMEARFFKSGRLFDVELKGV